MQLQNLKASKTILQNHPLTSIQKHFSCFLQKISGSQTPKPLFLPHFPQNPSSLKTQFDNTTQTIGNHDKQALQMGFFPFSSPSHPLFERAGDPPRLTTSGNSYVEANKKSSEAIKNPPKGITVYGYALKNSVDDFVWLPDVKTGKSLGLFHFEREDAQELLEQVKDIEPTMREGLKVDKVALDQVVKLKLDQGQKRCFIPNSGQIMNAPKEKVGDLAKDFYGVPVFQSQNLSVMIGDKRYHPVFFTKEDLDNSLNPALKKGDAPVCVLEEMIMGTKSLILVLTSQGKGKQNHPIFFRYEYLAKSHLGAAQWLKDFFKHPVRGDNQESPSSKWDEIIFIPPGGTNVSQ